MENPNVNALQKELVRQVRSSRRFIEDRMFASFGDIGGDRDAHVNKRGGAATESWTMLLSDDEDALHGLRKAFPPGGRGGGKKLLNGNSTVEWRQGVSMTRKAAGKHWQDFTLGIVTVVQDHYMERGWHQGALWDGLSIYWDVGVSRAAAYHFSLAPSNDSHLRDYDDIREIFSAVLYVVCDP